MYIETLYAKSLDELDSLVDEFTTDKIIYDMKYQQLSLGWNVHIFYDEISEGGEKL